MIKNARRSFSFIFFIFCALLLSLSPLKSTLKAEDSIEDIIKTYDNITYHPQVHGLKDLVVNIRVDHLLKQLNERLIFGKLKDVYFRLFWLNSGKIDSEIYGMPRGFQEIKGELLNSIINKIDHIIPKFLENDLKGMKLTLKERNKDFIRIYAKDPQGLNFINDMDLDFDSQGLLKKITTYGSGSKNEVSYTYTKTPWGQNKWVIDSVEIISTLGNETTTTTQRILYEKQDGIGVPLKIETKTTQILLQPATKNKDLYKREFKSELTFDHYKINTGAARSFS